MFSLAAIRSLDVSDPLPDIANDVHVRATDRWRAENVFCHPRALHLSAFEQGVHWPNGMVSPASMAARHHQERASEGCYASEVNEVDC